MVTAVWTQPGLDVYKRQAVTCQLRTDETTASGYFWSSEKGADISIAEGTLVTADIVTEEKAPIQMVIPLLKEFFSMKETER